MKIIINVVRRPDIADPVGTTVLRALHDLGFAEVENVRIDRTIHLETDADTTDEQIEAMCERLLINPVLEDFEVSRA